MRSRRRKRQRTPEEGEEWEDEEVESRRSCVWTTANGADGVA